MDDQQALNSIMQDLAVLHKASRPAPSLQETRKPGPSSPKTQNDVRVKFEHRGEKRILQVTRPVKLEDLRSKSKVAFGQSMDLHYTNNELVIPLTTQDDLDKAVELLDRSVHMKSLKILLVINGNTQATNLEPSPSSEDLNNTQLGAERKKRLSVAGSTNRDRSSPPPGYIPDELHEIARNGSFTSINSEGEFIPESMDQMLDPLSLSSPENSGSGSCPSLDSPLDGDNYPKSRMPRAQSYPDNHQEFPDYDNPIFEKFGKGGTYPRRYHVSYHHQEYNDGRKTFPRARRTQGTSFRSPVSFSPTDQSLSTSSGSSIFTPECDDSRVRRRGSDIDNPTLTVSDISPPSRSPRAPTNWRLGKLLGQGAFGRVYLCYDVDTGRELAVKQVQFNPDSPETSKVRVTMQIAYLAITKQFLEGKHQNQNRTKISPSLESRFSPQNPHGNREPALTRCCLTSTVALQHVCAPPEETKCTRSVFKCHVTAHCDLWAAVSQLLQCFLCIPSLTWRCLSKPPRLLNMRYCASEEMAQWPRAPVAPPDNPD